MYYWMLYRRRVEDGLGRRRHMEYRLGRRRHMDDWLDYWFNDFRHDDWLFRTSSPSSVCIPRRMR